MNVKTNVGTIVAFTAMLIFSTAVAQDEGISWDSLSDGQREVLSQLEESWDTLPAERRLRLFRGAERWDKMSRQQRKEARERFRAWRDLADDR
ncbi:MAG: DUF3106 domain-containing protein, partial [Gammaproteobacteria bacterium]|nr:DUF3106 domain-containing protein [Gammaproteobacteria bacterium]